jgi:hypothetical protein
MENQTAMVEEQIVEHYTGPEILAVSCPRPVFLPDKTGHTLRLFQRIVGTHVRMRAEGIPTAAGNLRTIPESRDL